MFLVPREETISITNFILLAYTDLFNKRAYDMVGTKEDPMDFVVYSYDRKEKVMKNTYSYRHDSNIHIVIPSSFDGNKKGSFLLVTKNKNNTFRNVILFSATNKVLKLPNTTAPPILYTQNGTLKPVLLMQTKDNLLTVEIENDTKFNEKKETGFLEDDERIHPEHTSTFVDLTGDHKADLALVILKNDEKYLKVLENTSGGFNKLFEMKLPKKSGPLVFNDFNKSYMNDLAFVSEEDGKYYLNVYYNTNERKDIMAYKLVEQDLKLDNFNKNIFSTESKYFMKQDLSKINSDNLDFCLSCESLGGIPSGIFDTDIDLDKNVEIFLTAKKGNEGNIIVPLRFNKNSKEFEVYTEMNYLNKEKNVLSFSTCDYKNEGRELCVINKIENNTSVLKILPNVLSKENMKISVTTVLDETKTLYGNGVVGTSYLLSIDEGAGICLGNSLPPGPFLHLKNQTATFGLGCLTFHINILRVTVPSYGDFEKTYVVQYDIVQNLDLIVGVGKNGKFNIRAFIIAAVYILKIFFVLFIVIILNFIIVGILHLRDARKQREARTKDSMHPLFRSLG